jgi:crossover junction endodeoxyribonuclease RuvC
MGLREAAEGRFMSTGILGIDPGKGGGIAAMGDGQVLVFKMPATVGDLVDTLRALAVRGFTTAFVENVHAMPRQGVVSCFTFGRGLGNIEAACQALGIRIEWVTPAKWQTALGCLSKGDKNITKRRAQELFPTLTITHAIADALLIAEWGRRQEGARVAAYITQPCPFEHVPNIA